MLDLSPPCGFRLSPSLGKVACSRRYFQPGRVRVARTPGFGVRGLSTREGKSRGPQNRGSALPHGGREEVEEKHV
jgi:hypothetical protein